MPDSIDFEGSVVNTTVNNSDNTPEKQDDATALNGGETADVTGKDGNTDNTTPVEENKDDNQTKEDTTSSKGELEPGTSIEYDGKTYTVAENGDIVDENNNVFKEAKDVEKWLAENETSDEEDEDLSIDAIRSAVGIDVVDENGNPVEFTNDAKGVNQYINSVISIKAGEIQQGAVNKLFKENPMLKQFIDYVQLNGTPRGFGDIPDRSGIQLDKDNPAQLEAVIRMAAQEFGNKSLNDSYIKYLRDSGSLYQEAKNQLDSLIVKDKQVREQIEAQAEQARQQEEKEIQAYWQSVFDVIATRNIDGYKLPESFVKEVNGQKITLTPDDFYDYLSRATEVDENGNYMTAYQRDLNNLSSAETLNKEIISAWLMFTGGTYKDLINMASKEDAVRKLKIKSKEQRTTKTIKITKPKESKADGNDILFG